MKLIDKDFNVFHDLFYNFDVTNEGNKRDSYFVCHYFMGEVIFVESE